eukprot:613498-Amphidinium_carterae.1
MLYFGVCLVLGDAVSSSLKSVLMSCDNIAKYDLNGCKTNVIGELQTEFAYKEVFTEISVDDTDDVWDKSLEATTC